VKYIEMRRSEELKVYLKILEQCLKVIKKLDKACSKKGVAIKWIALSRHDPYRPIPPKDPLKIILEAILDLPPEQREPPRDVEFILDVKVEGREKVFHITAAKLFYTGKSIIGDIYTAKEMLQSLPQICGD
jgi:hypothetical protein